MGPLKCTFRYPFRGLVSLISGLRLVANLQVWPDFSMELKWISMADCFEWSVLLTIAVAHNSGLSVMESMEQPSLSIQNDT